MWTTTPAEEYKQIESLSLVDPRERGGAGSDKTSLVRFGVMDRCCRAGVGLRTTHSRCVGSSSEAAACDRAAIIRALSFSFVDIFFLLLKK